ncbi:MAG: hypothetical protein CV087_21260 [Candidatus Brocadia sp. WS118]|nr:MAG: hypothetical protein CV087_21260 [Candidatus Brocadia sp. WS118]
MTFNLPYKGRDWSGCVADLHTPVSPLSRGELYTFETPKHQLRNDMQRNVILLNFVLDSFQYRFSIQLAEKNTVYESG